MFLVFNLLFQQSSSRALQTFPSICTAGPTISTLKSRKTVFPHCLHEIQKKPFLTLKTTSKMTQPPRRKKISCLLLTGTWIPRSQVTFSSGSCNAAAREQQGGDALLGATAQQQPECWTLVIHPGAKQARGHHSSYSAPTMKLAWIW